MTRPSHWRCRLYWLSRCVRHATNWRRHHSVGGFTPVFVEGELRNRAILKPIFADHSIDAVLHFAGLKPINESTRDPLSYHNNNVHGSQLLLQVMVQANVFYFVLSSSATVYGAPKQMQISETCPANRLTNPYGRSKQMV